jgi:transposase
MWPFGSRKKKHVPSPEEVMAKTGMSKDELTRRFMEHLIQQGKNPFKEMPEHMLSDAEEKFPDLVQLARRKFGTSR